MDLIYQSPFDLELGLLAGKQLPQVNNLLSKSSTFGNYRVIFTIIGESHKIEIWQNDSLVIAEILACISLPENRCLHHHSFKDGRNYDFSTNGLNGQIWFEYNNQPKIQLPNWIIQEFPVTNGLLPITRIEWEGNSSQLQWMTLHVYPQAVGYISVVSHTSLTLD